MCWTSIDVLLKGPVPGKIRFYEIPVFRGQLNIFLERNTPEFVCQCEVCFRTASVRKFLDQGEYSCVNVTPHFVAVCPPFVSPAQCVSAFPLFGKETLICEMWLLCVTLCWRRKPVWYHFHHPTQSDIFHKKGHPCINSSSECNVKTPPSSWRIFLLETWKAKSLQRETNNTSGVWMGQLVKNMMPALIWVTPVKETDGPRNMQGAHVQTISDKQRGLFMVITWLSLLSSSSLALNPKGKGRLKQNPWQDAKVRCIFGTKKLENAFFGANTIWRLKAFLKRSNFGSHFDLLPLVSTGEKPHQKFLAFLELIMSTAVPTEWLQTPKVFTTSRVCNCFQLLQERRCQRCIKILFVLRCAWNCILPQWFLVERTRIPLPRSEGLDTPGKKTQTSKQTHFRQLRRTPDLSTGSGRVSDVLSASRVFCSWNFALTKPNKYKKIC